MNYVWFILSVVFFGILGGYIFPPFVRSFINVTASRLHPKWEGTLIPKKAWYTPYIITVADLLTYYAAAIIGAFLFALTCNYQDKGVAFWFLLTVSLIAIICLGGKSQMDLDYSYGQKSTEGVRLDKTKPHSNVYTIAYGFTLFAYIGFFSFDKPPYQYFLNIPNGLANLIS